MPEGWAGCDASWRHFEGLAGAVFPQSWRGWQRSQTADESGILWSSRQTPLAREPTSRTGRLTAPAASPSQAPSGPLCSRSARRTSDQGPSGRGCRDHSDASLAHARQGEVLVATTRDVDRRGRALEARALEGSSRSYPPLCTGAEERAAGGCGGHVERARASFGDLPGCGCMPEACASQSRSQASPHSRPARVGALGWTGSLPTIARLQVGGIWWCGSVARFPRGRS